MDSPSLNPKPRQPKPHLKNSERFPRLFKEAARILKEVKSQKSSLKGAVYKSRLRGHCLRKVYGLSSSVITNLPIIDDVIVKVGLREKLSGMSEEYIEILVHELVLKGNQLPGESKPVKVIRKHKTDIEKAYEDCLNEKSSGEPFSNLNTDLTKLPKYARVNTLRFDVSGIIAVLTEIGFEKVDAEPGLSVKKYRNIMKNLKQKQFLQDIHFEDVLVFSHEENLIDLPLRQNFHILIQNKASCIPAVALNPSVHSVVLDCCAAPGMKTIHLSSLMENSGELYAVDKNVSRFTVLKTVLEEAGVKNCETLCMDFTKLDPNIEPFSNVNYILLDPSCSGSGIVSRLDSGAQSYSSIQNRIKKLSNLQITMLKHAMLFPSAKRIVYSTCSVHEEENEYVVNEALKAYPGKFSVVELFPEWKPRGLNKYSFGKLCIRASSKKNLTNGFFVAALEKCQD